MIVFFVTAVALFCTGCLAAEEGPPRPSSAGPDATASELAPPSLEPSPSGTDDAAVEDQPGARVLPTHLRIQAIGVDTQLIRVGLNPDGTLEVPQPGPDYDKAAWYEGSPAPGQIGPAVIEGHVDSAEDGPSVFFRLGSLVAGDLVDVTRSDSSVVRYVIDEVKIFPKDEFPQLEVYGNTDRPELRLITCGGEFDSARGQYEDNTVVFAHQVSP